MGGGSPIQIFMFLSCQCITKFSPSFPSIPSPFFLPSFLFLLCTRNRTTASGRDTQKLFFQNAVKLALHTGPAGGNCGSWVLVFSILPSPFWPILSSPFPSSSLLPFLQLSSSFKPFLLET